MALDYTFSPSVTLETMRVRICSRGAWPDALVPIHPDGAGRLRALTLELDGGRTPLVVSARIQTRALAPGACVALDIDLSPRADPFGTTRTDHAVFAPTSAWLWTPMPRPVDLDASARFVLPAGVARTPIFGDALPETGQIVLDDDAFHFVSYAAFGALEREVVTGAESCVELATLADGIDAATRRAWIESALDAVTHLGPALLPRRTSIVLVPTAGPPDTGSAVFGLAAHGAIPSVLLVAPAGTTLDVLTADWALVHELVHLTTPHVDGSGAWLTEGLATYYQEVLRARAGRIGAEAAWRALDDGFVRGLTTGSGASLREEAAHMHETYQYGRVYWSGAAVALLLDLELRRAGSSLDEAMARAAMERHRETSDRELAAILDGERGEIAQMLVERWGESTEPPDLSAAYAELGLTRVRGALELSPTGEAVRAAIMNPRPRPPSEEPTASRPSAEMVDCGATSGVSSPPTL